MTDLRQKTRALREMQRRSLNDVTAEVERITDMELTEPFSDSDTDVVSRHYVKPEEYERGFRLLPKQAEAMCAYNDVSGVFGPIAAGAGKTLITLLIADDCFREVTLLRMQNKGDEDLPNPRILLLVPSQVLTQLRDSDVAFARKHTRFSCHVHYISGVTKQKRELVARAGRRGLYLMTYDILSRPGSEELLEQVNPACVICDEAHKIAGDSARSKRFKRFVDACGPQVIALSGTLTKKSPMDYHYLAKVSLGQNNFLPNAVTLAEAWATLVDSTASSLGEFRGCSVPKAGPILPLVHWAQEHFPEEELPDNLIGFRKAYALRLRSTPGVVASGDNELAVSLLIENNPVSKEDQEKAEGYERQQELLTQLKEEWLTPGGDEIDHAIHMFKWQYELHSGFYNELFWPDKERLARIAKRRNLSQRESESLLERSQKYHTLHQDYMKALRNWLKYESRPKLDSPALVGGNMHHHGSRDVGEGLYRTWTAMKEADFEGRLERDSRSVRVTDFKIKACADYCEQYVSEGEGLIVWYANQEIGRWITEVLQERGVPVQHCPAGPEYNRLLLDMEPLKKKVLVCSLRAHGTGKNLQKQSTMYYLQWPRDASLAEQSIARQHRNGQLADEVTAVTCFSSEFDKITMAATLNDAAYVSATLGTKQRLIYAGYNPVPKSVPWTVMAAWGAQPKRLDNEAQGLLERFGS